MNNNLLMGGVGFEMGKPIYEGYNHLNEINNMKLVIDAIVYNCKDYLNGTQLAILNKRLNEILIKYEIISEGMVKHYEDFNETNEELIEKYLRACKIEGKSPRTVKYYMETFDLLLKFVQKLIPDITSDDVRDYLAFRKETGQISNTSLDNIRRVLSSIFTWFQEEGYLLKNPMTNIKKIKNAKKVKKPLTPKEIELIRIELNKLEGIGGLRDRALFELLLSSGIRIAELVSLNISDLDMDECTFIVLGKGNKERKCYFNVKTQVALELYLNARTDDNPALFVQLKKPYNRFQINGIERRFREISKPLNIKLHPHKIRRTMATSLLNKGVPIEQVQLLLGHSKLDTTTIYAQVDEEQLNHKHKQLLD